MAENQILIKFKPEGHKPLIKAINELSKAQKKLTKSVDKISKATEKANKKTGILTTKNNRLTDQNNKLALSFATIRSKMLLWSFAMSLGIRQLGQMAREAAVLEGMETAFNTLSGGAENAGIAIDKLRGATNKTMSDFDLFQQANNAMVLGVTKNSDEMAEMFDIAQRLGRALGRDTKSSVESLITGIGRQSRMMLDNIGIIVKAEEAYEAYAEKLGISADALSDTQRKQAFLTATMESAREKVSRLGTETPATIDSFNELSAAADNLQARIGESVNNIEPLIKLSAKLLDAMNSERIDRFARSLKLLGKILMGLAAVIGVAVGGLAIIIMGPMAALTAAITTISTTISSSYIAMGAAALAGSFGLLSFTDAMGFTGEKTEKFKSVIGETTKETEKLNKEFARGDVTVDDLGSSYESAEEEMLRYGDSVETVTNSIKAQLDMNELIDKHYGNTKEGRLDALNSQLATIDAIASEIGMTDHLLAVQASLIAQKEKLVEGMNDTTNGVEEEISARQRLLGVLTEEQQKKVEIAEATLQIGQETLSQFNAMTSAMANQVNTRMSNEINALKATERYQSASAEKRTDMEHEVTQKYAKERERVAIFEKASAITGAIINTALGVTKAAPNVPLMALIGAMGLAQVGFISATPLPKFATGGLVGGRRHSQGGTMIEAEQGEFVMSRNATEAIGIENLNRMNQGGGGSVNITFTGNVMSQDFIENDAIPQIKEAIRRGADIGVS